MKLTKDDVKIVSRVFDDTDSNKYWRSVENLLDDKPIEIIRLDRLRGVLEELRGYMCEREPYDDCNETDKARAEGVGAMGDYLIVKFDELFNEVMQD